MNFVSYMLQTSKQANKQTSKQTLARIRLSRSVPFIIMLLVMMVEISTGTVVNLQIGSPAVCERGAVEFQRSGYFGMKWEFDATPPTITNVSYSGHQNFEIRKSNGTVVFSYSQSFSVSNVTVTNCAAFSRCAYVALGDVLSSSQMSGIIQSLDPDTYSSFWWSDYSWSCSMDGSPDSGNNQEGSEFFAANFIILTADDLAFPIDVTSTVISGISNNVYPVYECNNTVPVLFHVDKIQELLGNQYRVSSQWAEVSSCNQSNPEFSEAKVSSLGIVYQNNEPLDILRISNLLHADVFNSSPFTNSANIGKRYRLRFTLYNIGNDCPEKIVNICVVFTGESDDIDFFLQSCSDSGNSDCEFGFVEASASEPGPTLGYQSPNIQLKYIGGIFEKYIYRLTHIDGSNETCLGYDILNILPQQYVTSNTITINMNSWEIGGNTDRFPYYTANDILQFKLEIFLINKCTRCLDGSQEVHCDFSNLDACEYDDLDELIAEFDVIKGEDAFAVSYFNIDPNTPTKPFDESIWVVQQANQEKTVSILPNPFSTTFDVISSDDEGQFILYDLNGKLLFQKMLNKLEVMSINMDHLANGMYIYQFVSKTGEIISNKLIKN